MHVEDGMFVVSNKHRYPVGWHHEADLDENVLGFEHGERRVRLVFESGAWLSIIWGSATFSSNYDAYLPSQPFDERPVLVEVLPSWAEEPEGYVDSVRMLELIAEANARGKSDD